MKVYDQLRIIMHTLQHNLQEQDIQSMTDKASALTYTSGALTALWGFVTSQEFGILAGVLIGLAGFAVNWYYKQKDEARKQEDERRKEELHQLKLKGFNVEE